MSKNEWLTDRERKIFDLFYRRGWYIEDIAAKFKIGRRSVDRILQNIRNRGV